MICIIYKYVIIWTTIYNLPTASSKSSFIPEDNRIKVVSIDVIPSVVLW